MRLKRMDGPLSDRLKLRLVETSDGCLEWPGQRDKDGYGRIQVGPGPRLTHRVAWELEHGPIPEGQKVLHHCDNPPCCNPTHLFLGSTQDNTDDMIRKGRDGYGWQRLKTHCKSGHEFTPENTRIDSNGWRVCRTCKGWKGAPL